MKEYTININVVVEAEESDYERVTEYAQDLADNLIQDEDFAYDGDIKILEVQVNDVQDLSDYSSDYTDYNDDNEDEE